MRKPYPKFSSDQDSPSQFFIVVPSDTAGTGDVPQKRNEWPVGFYYGKATAGDVKVVGLDDQAVVFSNVQPGSIIRVSFKRIASTGTTATPLITALYL